MTAAVPTVEWPRIAGRVQRRIMQPPELTPHMVFLARTGSGKDHLIRWGLLPYFPLARVVVLMTKWGADDLTWDGWGNRIAADELPPGFGRGDDDTPRYVIRLTGRDQDAARRLLDQLAAEGECIVIIGDTARLAEIPTRGGLNCEGQLTNMMRDGRASSLAIWACGNSGKWLTGGMRDQAAAVWIGHSAAESAAEFADLAGLERKSAERAALETLPPRDWLYTDHLDGELMAGVTTAPPVRWCSEVWPGSGPSSADVDRLRAAFQRIG